MYRRSHGFLRYVLSLCRRRSKNASSLGNHTHNHAHVHARTHTRAHTRTRTYTHTHSHTSPLANAYSIKLVHIRTLTLTHTRAHTRTRTHKCTHAHTHTRTRTHAHIYARTRDPLTPFFGQSLHNLCSLSSNTPASQRLRLCGCLKVIHPLHCVQLTAAVQRSINHVRYNVEPTK